MNEIYLYPNISSLFQIHFAILIEILRSFIIVEQKSLPFFPFQEKNIQNHLASASRSNDLSQPFSRNVHFFYSRIVAHDIKIQNHHQYKESTLGKNLPKAKLFTLARSTFAPPSNHSSLPLPSLLPPFCHSRVSEIVFK